MKSTLHASNLRVMSDRSNMTLYADTARISTGIVTPREEAQRNRVMSGIFRISARNWSMVVALCVRTCQLRTWISSKFGKTLSRMASSAPSTCKPRVKGSSSDRECPPQLTSTVNSLLTHTGRESRFPMGYEGVWLKRDDNINTLKTLY